MSALSDLASAAVDVTMKTGRLASAVYALEDFGLTDEQRVEFEVLLRNGLREIANGLRELVDAGVGSAALGGVGSAESEPGVIDARVDVHKTPSVGASAAGTVDASTPIVGDAPGLGFQSPFPGPGAISGGAA